MYLTPSNGIIKLNYQTQESKTIIDALPTTVDPMIINDNYFVYQHRSVMIADIKDYNPDRVILCKNRKLKLKKAQVLAQLMLDKARSIDKHLIEDYSAIKFIGEDIVTVQTKGPNILVCLFDSSTGREKWSENFTNIVTNRRNIVTINANSNFLYIGIMKDKYLTDVTTILVLHIDLHTKKYNVISYTVPISSMVTLDERGRFFSCHQNKVMLYEQDKIVETIEIPTDSIFQLIAHNRILYVVDSLDKMITYLY